MENNNLIPSVYNIFIDFFGEDKVDLQDKYIIVHFPKVTVTNEYDRSIDITDLFAKIEISNDGTLVGVPRFLRSSYTLPQLLAGYRHSHLPSISPQQIDRWDAPCFGTGPIRNTMCSLSTNCSDELWKLFCYELSKFITVESIEGTPYIRLEYVGQNKETLKRYFPEVRMFNRSDLTYTGISSSLYIDIINNFILYIIKNKPFGFNYYNNSYSIDVSEKEAVIILSNLFIEYYNTNYNTIQVSKEDLFHHKFLIKGKYINGTLYYNKKGSSLDYTDNIGKELLTFKGNPVLFSIIDDKRPEDLNEVILLSYFTFSLIIVTLLKIINSKYGKPNQTRDTNLKEVHKFF